MKVDRRYYYFGCEETGDCIDLAGKLLGLSPYESALRIAEDFNINISNNKQWNNDNTKGENILIHPSRMNKNFILLTKEDVYKAKLFGEGEPHKNVDEMIGDYVAIGITDLTIFNTREEADCFKGVHAGYTKDELLIPLIVFDSKK